MSILMLTKIRVEEIELNDTKFLIEIDKLFMKSNKKDH